MKLAQLRSKGISIKGKAAAQLLTVQGMILQNAEGWDEMQLSSQEFFLRVLGPYFFVHFLMLPLPLLFSLCLFMAILRFLSCKSWRPWSMKKGPEQLGSGPRQPARPLAIARAFYPWGE